MSLFAIADLHLSLGTNKPMDIFRGWTDYVSRLESNWKKLVTDNDTVIIGGDISWAMKLEETYEDFKFINELPGRKIFIKGNHDYWWQTKKKIEDYLKQNCFDTISIMFNNAYELDNYAVCGTRGWFYDAEADADKKIINREAGRLRTSIEAALKTGKVPVAFLHYPPVYQGRECEELMNILLEYKIGKCYYGHLHGSNAFKYAVTGDYKGVEMHLVSCDYLRFIPNLIR
ncbi:MULTISPECIES: metallophosphoesterase [unclassified Ruminococcus]|uniref:metallophosphoesterase n=1 Tax=unclassified Ruminococcus TaxID=2608920 RepID=UPI00210BE9A2|nr:MULTISPECIES: metallophosphoesterase [unclassified Ruminococcus]MCQ4023126.1 serine/threonine protein phosphatase [Ruminococcus sp. zg-924]MCQ4115103.1 serine/threonine protein phosphatase [Ruminococcus sp. zg-921]